MPTVIDELLDRRFPAVPLAVFRIVLGVTAVGLAENARTRLLELADPAYVLVPAFDVVPPVTPGPVLALTTVWTVSGVLLALGLRGRAAAGVAAGCAVLAAVWDVQTFSNHVTLFIALTSLLACSRCTAALSVDARRGGGAAATVPYWPVFLLRTQVSTMYGFTAVAKLTGPFLSGEVLRDELPLMRTLDGAVGVTWLLPALAVGTIAVEAFLAVGLWSRRLRLPAVVGGVVLHLAILVSIPGLASELAPFAAMALGSYLLFLGTDVSTLTEDAATG